MTSIRQRRRNRHKVKMARRQASRRLYLTLNIDVSRVNAAFAQAKAAMAKLFEGMGRPEFQKMINEVRQNLVASFSPDVIRGMISTQKSAQNHLYDAWRYQEAYHYTTLGDPSCRFNARSLPPQASRYIKCAVNPGSNCRCKHFEV